MPDDIATLEPTDISTDDEAQSPEVDPPVEEEVVDDEAVSVFADEVDDELVESDPKVAAILARNASRHEQALNDVRKSAENKADTRIAEKEEEATTQAYAQALDARSTANTNARVQVGATALAKYFKDAETAGIQELGAGHFQQLASYFDGMARTQVVDERKAVLDQYLEKNFPEYRVSTALANQFTVARGQANGQVENQVLFDILTEAVRETERPLWEKELEQYASDVTEEEAQAAKTKENSEKGRTKPRPSGDLPASSNGQLGKAAVEAAFALPTSEFLEKYDPKQRIELTDAADKLGI